MDINRILSGLSSSGVLGGLAGGAVSGALMSNKKARKTVGKVAKVGGIAALGAVAWTAYQKYQASSTGGANQPAEPRATDPTWSGLRQERFEIDPSDTEPHSTPSLLLQAMITAADSDGHMDGDELQRIMRRVDELDLAANEKAMIFDALKAPLSMAEICKQVESPELAIEVYLSSLLAIDESRSEARHYLDALAFRLGLPEELISELHANAAGQSSLEQVAWG
jgi:uncharacterized membrane protein YebE (DUF533 family)